MTTVKIIKGWQLVYLKHLRSGQPEHLAARLAGVGLDKVNETRQTDSEFADKCAKAKEGYSYENRVRW